MEEVLAVDGTERRTASPQSPVPQWMAPCQCTHGQHYWKLLINNLKMNEEDMELSGNRVGGIGEATVDQSDQTCWVSM